MISLLSVFIPAFNEQENLETCVLAVRSALEENTVPFEILIVDDASYDRTGEIADGIAMSDGRVRAIHHPQNLGIGGGFCSAIEHASGDWLLLIPADIAMNLDDLHFYIEAAAQADVVVGLRTNRDDYSVFRKLVSWVNIHLIKLLFGMQEHQFQFISMYRLSVLRKMHIEYTHSAFFLAEVLIKAKAMGMRLIEVEIRYIPRLAGRASGVSWRAILHTMRDMLHFWIRWVRYGAKGIIREQA